MISLISNIYGNIQMKRDKNSSGETKTKLLEYTWWKIFAKDTNGTKPGCGKLNNDVAANLIFLELGLQKNHRGSLSR